MKGTVKICFTFFIVLVMTASTFSITYAKDSYTTSFNNRYGTSGTKNGTTLGSCITCHNQIDGKGGYNPYGIDWRNNGMSYAAVEPLDSDNDGFTNLEEISAGAFPGDPNSQPAPTASPPVANAGPDQTVDEGIRVTLDGSNSSDPDNDIVSYFWQQTAGPSVALSNASAVRPTFTAPNVGANGASLTFQLTVSDSGGLQSADACIVNVVWINLPPTVDAGPDQTANEGDTVTLDGSNSSDLDDGIASYQWTQTGGPSVTLSSTTAVQPIFTAPNVGPSGTSLTFQLTATDSGGLQSTDACIVNVVWLNLPPTSDAGFDQTVDEGIRVTLDGSNSSDPDDGIGAYQWAQTAGPPVTLSNTTAIQPTFTAPSVGPSGASLAFQLTVTDNEGLQSMDSCIVNVLWVNLPPTADAGPDQTVNEGDTVLLDGSNSSDPDDGIASYQWTQTAGPAVTLSDPWAATPTFTAPVVGAGGTALTFQMTVFDGLGQQSTDICNVNVTRGTLPPTADAGPDRTVNGGDTVLLDGSNSSDPDDGIATYEWTQTGGTPVTLSSTAAVQPTFIAPNVGPGGASLTFHLTVTDNAGLKSTDTCIVNVSWVNLPPTADAGPDQTVNEEDTVILDGSNSSDPDDGIATYMWTQTGGTPVTLSSTTAVQPAFTAPNVGPGGASLIFQLTVTDNGGLQSTNTCIVNASWINLPPMADAGADQTVDAGVTVVVDGSNSTDPDDGIGTYLWTQTGGPSVTLSDTSAVKPTFTSPNVGPNGASLTFQLTVTDNGGLKSTDTGVVNVSWVNLPPTADAGPDQTVVEGATVSLDGNRSSDPDDGMASFLWRQTGGPTVTLSDARAPKPDFVTPPVDPGSITLTFDLTVGDTGGLQTSDTVVIHISDNGITGFPNDVLPLTTPTGEEIGIKVVGGGSCTSLISIDPASIPHTFDKPGSFIFGLINIKLKADTPGAEAKVTIYLSHPVPDGYRWYKYSSTRGWIDYSANAVFNVDRDEITLTLVDGGQGDDDGVANGVIVDPSGLGASASTGGPITVSGGEFGGGGGCFVAASGHVSELKTPLKLFLKFHQRSSFASTVGKALKKVYQACAPQAVAFRASLFILIVVTGALLSRRFK
jgi:hypothetical protein